MRLLGEISNWGCLVSTMMLAWAREKAGRCIDIAVP
jgi:hypothetical protein